MAVGSRSVVLAALCANLAIAAMKLGGYLITGSPSMLSEAYHSVSDTGNQVLLLLGLSFSQRTPTREHPYGWGKAEFFYGFVVAMFLFGIAGWESLWKGIEELQHPAVGDGADELFARVELLGSSLPAIWVNYAVLALAALFEGWAFKQALAGMRASMKRGRHRNLWETFQQTKEATVLTAFSEDLMALVGLAIATVALALTHTTGNHAFDAVGAVLIGSMLMGFALLLAWEQKRLLLGEAMEPWQEKEIRSILLRHEQVEACENLRTVYFGADNVLLTADLSFTGELGAAEIDDIVDGLETRVKGRFPGIRYIYLETASEVPPLQAEGQGDS